MFLPQRFLVLGNEEELETIVITKEQILQTSTYPSDIWTRISMISELVNQESHWLRGCSTIKPLSEQLYNELLTGSWGTVINNRRQKCNSTIIRVMYMILFMWIMMLMRVFLLLLLIKYKAKNRQLLSTSQSEPMLVPMPHQKQREYWKQKDWQFCR